MSGNGKGGNSSTSGGNNARTNPYNTRNKGSTYTSLNNANDDFSGYDTATSKKTRRKEGQSHGYKPKNSQTVDTSTQETASKAANNEQNDMEVDNGSPDKTIDEVQAQLNAMLEEAAKQNAEENAKNR